MSNLAFPLEDPAQIFGNDAAEDESESAFESYALHRPEIAKFADARKPLQVVRAYKGEGKSALLRLVEGTLRIKHKDSLPIIIRTTGPAL